MNSVAGDGVVNGEWETLGEGAVLAENDLVDAGVKLQRINVGEQTVEEVIAKPGFLFLVEMKTGNQVLPGIIVEFDLHETCRRISALADSQKVYPALPSATRF